MTKTTVLPAGIKDSDLKAPNWDADDKLARGKDGYGLSFDLWYTPAMGWVIPTLQIARGRRGYADRTYAVRVDGTGLCRVGQGPHVTAQHTVYVRESRANALAKYVTLLEQGTADSHQVRDRISTRRAQGALYRMNRGW
jgi:hypothetical protein